MSSRVLISKKLVIINSASSLITRLLSIFALIWVQQYLLERIAVEEYSLLPVIYSLMVLFPIFTLVLSSGILRYVTAAYADGREEDITQIVSTMFPLLCLGSLFLFAVGGTLAWYIDEILRIEPEYVDDVRIMLLLIILLETVRLPMQAFSSGLYVNQRFVLENLINISCECLRLAILFILLLGISVSVVSVVVASVVGGFVQIVILLIVSRRLVTSQRFDMSKFKWSIAKELTNFGGWSSLYGLAGMIRKAADPIILNRFSTPLDVTCFHLGALIPNRLEVLVNNSFLQAVSPVVVGLHVERQDEKLKKIYLRLGRLAMWGMLLVIAPFLVHYEQIVTLYVGTTYLSAGTVLFLLLACYPIVYGNILHSVLADAKLRMRPMAIRETVSAVVNVSLTLVLVGYYQLGAIGAATATFIVYGLGSILLFWPFGKGMVDATWSEIWDDILLPGILPFISGLLSMKLLTMFYPVESWATIAVNAMMGASVYLVAVWFTAKEIDKSQFRDALHSIYSRKSSY